MNVYLRCITSSYTGRNRYSVPQCTPLGKVDDFCSLSHPDPRPFTLHYPNGIQVDVEEAHLGLCPCEDGLTCSSVTSTCQVSTSNPQALIPSPQAPTYLPPPSFRPQAPGYSPQVPSSYPQLPTSDSLEDSYESDNSPNSIY